MLRATVGGLGPSADGKTAFMAMDRNEFPIAFAKDADVIVNFGILSGREATQAELDRLALALRHGGAGAQMTITAERHQDYGRDFEGVIHQVRVTLAGSPDRVGRGDLRRMGVGLRRR